MAEISIVIRAKNMLARALNEARGQLAGFAKSLRNFGSGALGQIGQFLGVAAIGRFVKDVALMGDAIDEGSKRIAVSATEYQKLGFAAKRSGADIGAVESAIKRQTKVMQDAATGNKEAAETLGRLGLTAQGMAGKSNYEQFLAIADALTKVTNETERMALAQEIFGRGGLDLLPMIGDVQQLGAELENLGGIMSNEMVAKSAQLADSIDNLKASFVGVVANSGIVEFLARYFKTLEDVIAKGKELRTLAEEKPETFRKVGYLERAGNINADLLGSRSVTDKLSLAIGMGYIAAGLGGETATLKEQSAQDILAAQARAKAEMDKRNADKAAAQAADRQRQLVREQQLQADAAAAAQKAADEKAKAAAKATEAVNDQIKAAERQLYYDNLRAEGNARLAAQIEAVDKARSAAESGGTILGEGQRQAMMDLAGRQFDLQKAQEEAQERQRRNQQELNRLETERKSLLERQQSIMADMAKDKAIAGIDAQISGLQAGIARRNLDEMPVRRAEQVAEFQERKEEKADIDAENKARQKRVRELLARAQAGQSISKKGQEFLKGEMQFRAKEAADAADRKRIKDLEAERDRIQNDQLTELKEIRKGLAANLRARS